MPRKKLSQTNQLHGKLEPELENEKPEITMMEQLWADEPGLAKYKTYDAEEYKTSLASMDTADLRGHAAKLGVMPVPNRERLTKRLVLEFNKYTAQFQKPKSSPPKAPNAECLKIMREVL